MQRPHDMTDREAMEFIDDLCAVKALVDKHGVEGVKRIADVFNSRYAYLARPAAFAIMRACEKTPPTS
jgi:hypothetical protein